MSEEKYYSIGQASKICDVSPRMLRYYEEIGLITPDKISSENRYRYYTISTMRDVQAIRYLIDQGFSLDEIKQVIINDDIDMFQQFFLNKIEETQHTIEYCQHRIESLKGWCSLIIEGKNVLRHRTFIPCTKYIPEKLYFYYERKRDKDEKNSDVYIETEYFTKSKKDGHSMIDVGGAFNLYYGSWNERIDDTYEKQTLLQTMYDNSNNFKDTMKFGGFNAVCAYHIGDMSNISITYNKLVSWANDHNFNLRGDCLERHIIDIYSTLDSNIFVTELLLPLDEPAEDLEILSRWSNK